MTMTTPNHDSDPWHPEPVMVTQAPESRVFGTYDPSQFQISDRLDISDRSGLSTGNTTRMIGVPICPDLLDLDALGVADNWRGRVVRAFFWLLARFDALMERWQ